MKINSNEIKKEMNLLKEKIKELEEKLDSEIDIEMFELNWHRIEDYRESLQNMAIKKEELNY